MAICFVGQKSITGAQTIETKSDKPQLVVQTGHSGSIKSIAFSPNGKLLASGSEDKTIKLWDINSGNQLKTFPNSSDVESVSFSPNSKFLASVGKDKIVRLWNVLDGKELRTFTSNTYEFSGVRSVFFNSDGKILSLESGDGTLENWDAENGKYLKTQTTKPNNVDTISYSPNGKTLATVNFDAIKLWDVNSQKEIRTLTGHSGLIEAITFSPDGEILASGSEDKTIKLWDVNKGGELKTLTSHTDTIELLAFNSEGTILASGIQSQILIDESQTIKFWNIEKGNELKTLSFNSDSPILSLNFNRDGKFLILSTWNGTIQLFDAETRKDLGKLTSASIPVAISPDGKILASGSVEDTIKLWDINARRELKTLIGNSSIIKTIEFSPNGNTLASAGLDKTIKIWDAESGKVLRTLKEHSDYVWAVAFSPNGKVLASGSEDKTIKLWDIESGKELKSFVGHLLRVWAVSFNKEGKILASISDDKTIKLWDVESGNLINSLDEDAPTTKQEIAKFFPKLLTEVYKGSVSDKLTAEIIEGSGIQLSDKQTGKKLATLIALDNENWVVTTPDGRFDTNEDLNKIEGLIWVLPDQPLTPKPLELYMRQYYEPGLLPRVLRCTEENNCDTEFKPLPSIAEINRVQPKVEIKEIKPKANSGGLVDVVVEVESRTEEIAQKRLTSGVFDLRLFRDGQMVGTSARVLDLEEYIKSAPQAIEKDRAAKTLLNTEEDKAWRKANDLARVVKFDKNKATFVFENVRLPQDGRKAVEFSAYAFNDDRVKSETSRKSFEISKPTTRAGNTYLVSIGVNASENPNYNLNYAAVDAYKTQEILGERLKAKQTGTNSKLIQINLVSDYGANGKLNEKTATKPNIEALFNRLAGKSDKTADFSVLIDGQKVSADKLPAISPEDTLIITYSGHGYADRNGIFYLLPYDIGEKTEKLTTEVLPRLISSDELSLWMRDVTAREMLMIVDACHSAAAVQGDGFKPGPMGSRGLGQLAYDKGMKILSATQADNVALELGGSLKQGLLSYALLQDGIFSKLADADSNKQLFFREWLKYGENRVPALYEGIKNGTIKSVTIDNKSPTEKQRSAVFCVDKSCRQNIQQPKLFDFNEKRADSLLINLP